MPDPLSLATGILAFLQITGTVAWQLKQFHDGASVINQTLGDLSNGVAGLQRVLLSMRDAFEHITAEQGTGHVASLWNNVARAVVEGKDILGQLNSLLKEVDRDSKHLNDHRKQLRLKGAEIRIARFRQHVDSYRDGLQLSMQTIVLVNQAAQSKTADDKILPNLDALRNDIRSIALDMNSKIQNLEAHVKSSRDETHIVAMKNLQQCVRSAASTISSATTIMSLNAENDVDSSFGDLFPSGENLAISRWMQSCAVTTYEESTIGAEVPQSVADVLSLNGDDAADSDDELQGEMTRLLWQSGMQKLRAGDEHGAEKQLRNCHTRLKAAHARAIPNYIQLRLDTIQSLYAIYRAQQKWSQCQDILAQKMAIIKATKGKQHPGFLADVLELAFLRSKQNDYKSAHLHATAALKGYWKLRNWEEATECLELLVIISEKEQR